MRKLMAILLAAALLLAGCGTGTESGGNSGTGDSAGAAGSYTKISQEEAAGMMARDDGHVIVDVRRQDEYDAGHIPGAILIPNEDIGTDPPAELPDKEQVILLYCRTGNRSSQAGLKLAGMGYTNVYDFGGIEDWTGAVVTGEEETMNTEDYDAIADAIQPVPTLVIEANGHTFYADLEDNSSAEALTEKLSSEWVTVDLHDYGNFEKVGPLPWSLPRNDVSITTVPGDVILYQGDQITIYYDENSWEFTRLARIEGATREDLLDAFGEGDVTVTFRIEWSE